jgi:hypothetical protein
MFNEALKSLWSQMPDEPVAFVAEMLAQRAATQTVEKPPADPSAEQPPADPSAEQPPNCGFRKLKFRSTCFLKWSDSGFAPSPPA